MVSTKSVAAARTKSCDFVERYGSNGFVTLP
jgi:hypothetical protein